MAGFVGCVSCDKQINIMGHLRVLWAVLCCWTGLAVASAAVWQWSVSVTEVVSSETGTHPQAFLWIPEDCREVKAVVAGMHNMTEETIFEHPLFREEMAGAGVAVVWVTPGFGQEWRVEDGCQAAFDRMMEDLASVSGYDELARAPVVPLGHSAMATFPWNFAAWNPERTLAVVSFHGDAPRTNLTGYGRENLEWGRTRNIDGIPGLMIEGEYEWWEARVNPALAFRMMYPGSCVSFLCDAGRGHFDVSDRTVRYIARFVQKALEFRVPDSVSPGHSVALKKLRPEDGWLAERWRADGRKRAKAAPYAQYKGDPHDAFWYFDGEMAGLTEGIYRSEAGKKPQHVGFMQDGRLLSRRADAHVKVSVPFRPEGDGLTFHLKAVYTDSTCTALSDDHADVPATISRICGPVRQVDDTTFVVSFYRMGMHNRRRTGSITLLAASEGDRRYKGAVQELGMEIPYRQTEGRRQCILFPGLDDVGEGTSEVVPLNATSDCGLPVCYYVKEGPAEVDGNRLRLTPVPPRSKYPVKVTVVAWQYGLPGKVQTAEPVERSFYIFRNEQTNQAD